MWAYPLTPDADDAATPELDYRPAIIRRPFQMSRARTIDIYAADGGTVDILPPLPRRRPVIRATPLPALPLPVRRFLSIGQAAEYVGVSVATFREEVEDGRWPLPVRRGRTGRAVTWDRAALDAAADRMAGIVPAASVAADADAARKVASAGVMARMK